MVGTILVPLDGSSLSRHALPFAGYLAQAMRARLVLFHAYRAQSDDVEMDPEVDLVREQADLASGLRQRGLNATTWLSYDEPGPAIVNAAADLQADLIVMSTHGRGGLSQFVYGSVADHVMRRSSVPVVLVTAHAGRRWTDDSRLCLLVPLDGSPFAEAALGSAGELARLLSARVVLLRIPSLSVGRISPWHPHQGPRTLKTVECAERYLEETATGLRSDGCEVEIRVEIGPPAEVIAGVADELSPALVVMATHERGAMSRFVVGSVASEALKRLAAPVLLIRPQQEPEHVGLRQGPAERSVV